MTTIRRDPTPRTPGVRFNSEKGLLYIKGRSSPENTLAFYNPIKDGLNRSSTAGTLNVKICLEYFNTSSSKCLFDILKVVKLKSKNGTEVNVFWYFEEDDMDMMEAGEDFSDILDLPFSYIQYNKDIQ